MKNITRIPILLSTVLALSSGLSQASTAFADGDLAVAFYSISGSGSSAVFGTTYYVVNLGPASLYRENTKNNVSVSTINTSLNANISADLAEVFGSTWAEDGSVRWMVVTSRPSTAEVKDGDPNRTLYLSAARNSLDPATLGPDPSTVFPNTISQANMNGSNGQIIPFLENVNDSIAQLNGNTSTPGINNAGVRLNAGGPKSLDKYLAGNGTYFTLGNNPSQTFGAGTVAGSAGVEGALDIFRLLYTTTGADLTVGATPGNAVLRTRQFIGALTLDASGNLKMSAVGAAASTGNYSTWAATNNVTGGASADSDNDGISNLLEYALALNPAGADGSTGTFVGGVASFTKRDVAVTNNDLTYAIQESDDLGLTDPWETVTPTTNTTTNITYSLPTGSPKKFIRLTVKTNP